LGSQNPCKKRIVIRKKIIRVVCPPPRVNVTAPQGPAGPAGPPGPPVPVIIPDTMIIPTVRRYFYVANSDIQATEVIPATQFTNDDGEVISEFTGLNQNSFTTLYAFVQPIPFFP
jgi:hypothetical protein